MTFDAFLDAVHKAAVNRMSSTAVAELEVRLSEDMGVWIRNGYAVTIGKRGSSQVVIRKLDLGGDLIPPELPSPLDDLGVHQAAEDVSLLEGPLLK